MDGGMDAMSAQTLISEFPLFIQQAIDLFYKIAVIITLSYAAKALKIYIDKSTKK